MRGLGQHHPFGADVLLLALKVDLQGFPMLLGLPPQAHTANGLSGQPLKDFCCRLVRGRHATQPHHLPRLYRSLTPALIQGAKSPSGSLRSTRSPAPPSPPRWWWQSSGFSALCNAACPRTLGNPPVPAPGSWRFPRPIAPRSVVGYAAPLPQPPASLLPLPSPPAGAL